MNGNDYQNRFNQSLNASRANASGMQDRYGQARAQDGFTQSLRSAQPSQQAWTQGNWGGGATQPRPAGDLASTSFRGFAGGGGGGGGGGGWGNSNSWSGPVQPGAAAGGRPDWGAIGQRLQQRFGGGMPWSGGMMQRPQMPQGMPWGGMQGGGPAMTGGWQDQLRSAIASRFGGGGQEPGGGIVNPMQGRGIVPEGWGQGTRR